MSPKYLISLSIPLVAIAALWSPALSQVQNQRPYWTKAAPPTIARQELYPEVLNGKIYVVCGLLNPNTQFSDRFEAYDPTKNAWTVLRPLPQARHHIMLSAVNGLQ